MVVDDEEDLLAVTKKMLEINGYSVHAFDNPIKGLEHVENEGCKKNAALLYLTSVCRA